MVRSGIIDRRHCDAAAISPSSSSLFPRWESAVGIEVGRPTSSSSSWFFGRLSCGEIRLPQRRPTAEEASAAAPPPTGGGFPHNFGVAAFSLIVAFRHFLVVATTSSSLCVFPLPIHHREHD